MAHHGDKPFDGMNDHLRKAIGDREAMPVFQQPDNATAEERQRLLTRALLDTTSFVGAVGTHTQGKLTKEDEGDVQFRVGSENGKVVLDFGTPVHWVGMDAQQAADLASSLMKWARIVGRKNGQTIAINLNAT
tara:strand:+ start:21511 stop:21909 length:399 start_codon:yes stop_codon:yes gene_type:complete